MIFLAFRSLNQSDLGLENLGLDGAEHFADFFEHLVEFNLASHVSNRLKSSFLGSLSVAASNSPRELVILQHLVPDVALANAALLASSCLQLLSCRPEHVLAVANEKAALDGEPEFSPCLARRWVFLRLRHLREDQQVVDLENYTIRELQPDAQFFDLGQG